MSQYCKVIDLRAEGLVAVTSAVSVGELKHQESFSWSPTATPTNGEDKFFVVPTAIPLIDGNFKAG
jgi:hypothetical protein